MRFCRRSFSCTSASPISTRVIPGFFAAKFSSMLTMASICASGEGVSVVMRAISPNSVCSMNSIRPSYIWALLEKCRYNAASDTPMRAASAAVVIFSGCGSCSIAASVCRICKRRSPGFLASPSHQTLPFLWVMIIGDVQLNGGLHSLERHPASGLNAWVRLCGLAKCPQICPRAQSVGGFCVADLSNMTRKRVLTSPFKRGVFEPR